MGVLRAASLASAAAAALLCSAAAAPSPWRFPTGSQAAPIAVTESGASGLQWAARPPQAWAQGAAGASPAIALDLGAPRQEVLGFGSCFTDTSAYNLLVYAQPAVREQLLEAVFGESGLRSSVMRQHINSPDYAVHTYSFDDVDGDFALAHFDAGLAYDQQRVIPFIHAAQAKAAAWTNHSLKTFASPWSPPAWMKQNGNMINSDAVCLRPDTPAGDSYAQAWASYILRWLQAYQANGIMLWGLTPQNEPEARQQHFESCAYDVPHYVEWLGKYLGPTVLPHFPALKILSYDHNKLDSVEYMTAIAADAAASAASSGAAVHWYDYTRSLGIDELEAVHASQPGKIMLATEACFLESLTFDWENTAFLYAADIIADLNHWVQGWVAWNTLLLTGSKYPESRGGPNHDNTTVFGDGILLEYNSSGTQRLIFQSSYWVRQEKTRAAPPLLRNRPHAPPLPPPLSRPAGPGPLLPLHAPWLCHHCLLWRCHCADHCAVRGHPKPHSVVPGRGLPPRCRLPPAGGGLCRPR